MGVATQLSEPDDRAIFVDRLEQLRIRIGGRLHLGPFHQSNRLGLRRDLTVPLARPSAKIPISIRPLTTADLPALFAIGPDATPADRLDVAWRRAFAARRPKGGFVAVNEEDGTPCYVQWLFGSADNDFVAHMGGFPQLAEDEALLENAYTPPHSRGKGIMSEAMALIAERAADFGARYVLTFVGETNIASLKGCQRAGFAPDLLHTQTRIGFGLFRHDSFTRFATDDPRRTPNYDRPKQAAAA